MRIGIHAPEDFYQIKKAQNEKSAQKIKLKVLLDLIYVMIGSGDLI